MPRKTALAALAGAFLLVSAPAALAGDRYGGDAGWSPPVRACHCDCGGCAHAEDVHLPSSFFDDSGGIGPAYVDYGAGSSGVVVEFVRPSMFPNQSIRLHAQARAQAEARAFVHVGVHVHGDSGGSRW